MCKSLKRIIQVKRFEDGLVLVLVDTLKGIAFLMSNLKEFGALAGFKINNQKLKMLIKI